MKKSFYTTAFILFFLSQNAFSERVSVEEYIEVYRDFSISEMYRTGIPSSIKLGQGILESDSGNSELSKNSNNHFGIKCKSNWKGNTYYHEDDDYDTNGKLLESCFRSYFSPYESYLDHSEFLSKRKRYEFLFSLHHTDYKQWAHGLKAAGYATATGYAEKLIEIIERYNLAQYDYMPHPYEVKPLALSHTFEEDEELVVIGNKDKTNTASESNVTVELEVAERGHDPFENATTVVEKPVEFFPMNGKRYFQINDIVAVSSTDQTLLQIAEKNEIKLKKLLKYNEIETANDLIPNQYIFLMKKQKSFNGLEKTHIVQEGENMYIIAQRYGIRLKHLYKMNRMKKGTQPTKDQLIVLSRKVKKASKVKS